MTARSVHITDATNSQAKPVTNGAVAISSDETPGLSGDVPDSEHRVEVYDTVDQLAASVAEFLVAGIRAGDAILVIATKTHWEAFVRQAAAGGEDLEERVKAGQVTRLDAHETLSKFMRDGMPDANLFHQSVGHLVAARSATLSGASRLRAYGEMVDVLWQEGQRSAALRLEELWNELQHRHSFALLCAYAMAGFYNEPEGLNDVLDLHTHSAVAGNGNGALPGVPSDLIRRQARRLTQETIRRSEIEKALRSSLAELRHREEQLRLSESQLRLVTDALPMLVSFIDAGEQYQFVSAAYERWFGDTKDAVVGRHMKDVLGPEAYAAIEPHVRAALSGSTVTYEAEVPYRAGGTRFVEATYIPQRSSTGAVVGFVAFVADATERRAFEQFRAAESARSARLLRVTAGIADAVRAEDVYVALVDRVAEAMNASSAALWLVDEDSGVARLARSRGYSDEVKSRLARLRIDQEFRIPALDSIRQGEPVWIASQAALLEEYPHLRDMVSTGRRYRSASLPLMSQGRVLGTLALTIEEERSPTTEEKGFLLLISRYAGQALERLRLYQETLDAQSRAEQLYAFAHAVSAASNLDDVFSAALTSIEAALGTGVLAILTMDDDAVMRFRAWRNLSDTYRGTVEGHSPWNPDDGHFEPVLVPDALDDPALGAYANLFRSEGIGALGFFPMVNRGKLLGKFMVYFPEPHRFTANEVDIATSIGSHLASVMVRFAAISRLEETIRSNELFAAVLAHDLRNPLGAIMNSAQVVLMRQEGRSVAGDAHDHQPLSRILRSGQRMTAMIDQLLDFTRARAGGGIDIEPHATNLAELCAQAVAELELIHPEWKISIDVLGNSGGLWDAARLLQVISNVVGNAGQHGTQGGDINVTIDGRVAGEVTLSVRNDGTIPEALRSHLFDPFQGSHRTHNHNGGLGLGLFIVREVVRAHGGDVVATCDNGQTTITMRLPRTATRTRRAAQV